MESFGGHALSGSFFILFALWYAVQTFRRYFICRQRNAHFTSTAAFSCDFLCEHLKELPVEALLKIIFVVIGFIGEAFIGFGNGYFTSLSNLQDATMLFFFGMTGVVDLLVFYHAPLPPNTDYVSNIIFLSAEWLLFHFSVHGHKQLDTLVHTLLIYSISASIAAVAMEMHYRHSVLGPLGRSYFFLLQGTWFWHMSFILYNPSPSATPWNGDSDDELMTASLFFIWHCAINFIILLLIGSTIACWYQRQGVNMQEDGVSMKRLIHTSANGQTVVTLNDSDVESDLEFYKPLSSN